MLSVDLLVRTGGNWSFHCKNNFAFLCAAIYTHSTTNCQNIYPWLSNVLPVVEMYTPDSAIYSLLSQQQVCMPYMTPFSAFDLPMHYSILYISLWKTLTTELLPWLQTSWGDSGHEKVIEVIFLVQSRIPAQHELGCQWNSLHTYTKKGRYLALFVYYFDELWH